ncbi:MAG: alpha/beta fold hydrolase [Rhizomicrobium sp.]
MSRPDILMIHGAFCGPWAFEKFRKPFEAAGYRVHAPPLRFHEHGASANRALGTTSLVDYANDLAKFIEGLEAPPVLLGHSLGGLLAQMLAAKGLARALVLLAPSPPWGVLPSTFFEIASAQDHAAGGRFLERAAEAGLRHRGGQFARPSAAGGAPQGVARFVPGIGARDVRDHALGVRRQARRAGACRKRDLSDSLLRGQP